jgi:hypothetical protein
VIRLAGTNETKGGRHHPVLQALIVLAVAGLVAALAIPAFAAQAKTSVLRQNQVQLALQVKTCLVLDTGSSDVNGVSSATDMGAATAIASVLREEQHGGGDGHFGNPLSGSSAIVCSSTPPAARGSARPAVWVTDSADFAYAAFGPSRMARPQLAGSLVVAAVEKNDTVTIDIYYIDGHGRRSPSVETIATPAAAWQE